MFGWQWKSERMENVSLNKFTHRPLLKNDGQLKQKSDKQPKKKKKQSPNLLKKKKKTITPTAQEKKRQHPKKK